jgi:hypothetical protein
LVTADGKNFPLINVWEVGRMLAFVVGVLVGSGAALLIIGFIAAVDEEDERRHMEALARKRSSDPADWYGDL